MPGYHGPPHGCRPMQIAPLSLRLANTSAGSANTSVTGLLIFDSIDGGHTIEFVVRAAPNSGYPGAQLGFAPVDGGLQLHVHIGELGRPRRFECLQPLATPLDAQHNATRVRCRLPLCIGAELRLSLWLHVPAVSSIGAVERWQLLSRTADLLSFPAPFFTSGTLQRIAANGAASTPGPNLEALTAYASEKLALSGGNFVNSSALGLRVFFGPPDSPRKYPCHLQAQSSRTRVVCASETSPVVRHELSAMLFTVVVDGGVETTAVSTDQV